MKLDFNNRNARGEVRIGPAALDRLGSITPSQRVLVVDADGNQCNGVIRLDPARPDCYVVVMDWQTWVESSQETGRPYTVQEIR